MNLNNSFTAMIWASICQDANLGSENTTEFSEKLSAMLTMLYDESKYANYPIPTVDEDMYGDKIDYITDRKNRASEFTNVFAVDN